VRLDLQEQLFLSLGNPAGMDLYNITEQIDLSSLCVLSLTGLRPVSVVNDNGYVGSKPKIPMMFPGCIHGKEKD